MTKSRLGRQDAKNNRIASKVGATDWIGRASMTALAPQSSEWFSWRLGVLAANS
jgi:hypothetical protein